MSNGTMRSGNDMQETPTSRRNPFSTPSPRTELMQSPLEQIPPRAQRKSSMGTSKRSMLERNDENIKKWNEEIPLQSTHETTAHGPTNTQPSQSQVSLAENTHPVTSTRDIEANLTSPRIVQGTRFIPQPSKHGSTWKKLFNSVRSAFIPSSSPSESRGGTEVETNTSSVTRMVSTAVTGPQLASIVQNQNATTGRRFLRTKSLPVGKMPSIPSHALQFENDQSPVDVIVIDYDFDSLLSQTLFPSASHHSLDSETNTRSAAQSHSHHSKVRGSHQGGTGTGKKFGNSMGSSHPGSSAIELVANNSVFKFLRWRALPVIFHFFHSDFQDPEKEKAFMKESWFQMKPTALATSFFFLLAWVLVVALAARPIATYNEIWNIGIEAPILILPFFLVAFDLPRRNKWAWQFVLVIATWSLPYITLFDMWNCGFFLTPNTCGSKDFIGIFYYSIGFPALALLCLGLERSLAAAGAIGYIIITAVLILPRKQTFVRNLINFIVFQIAMIWVAFLKDKGDRRMFNLREQLKAQYRATQKAQVNERTASDSKRRFVSYIFHEVRVPLNTATLAMQNLEGEGVFKNIGPDMKEMVSGLVSSLMMMQKVLNDVLDFNRMEAGKLTVQSKPFEFHEVFKRILFPFRSLSNPNLEIVADYDPRIDAFSPVYLGDDQRLTQVIGNLISNACKFTPSGLITVRTKLIHPTASGPDIELHLPTTKTTINDESPTRPSISSSRHSQDEQRQTVLPKSDQDIAIIRIEVEDTGVGIRPRDLIDNRLFSPYIQTEIGRRQGGKGSGLGLALVRQIVKLSDGRLGVSSQLKKGSTFWFELAFRRPPADTPPVDELVPAFGDDLNSGAKLHSMALQASQSQQSKRFSSEIIKTPRTSIETNDLIGIVPTISRDPLEQHVALLASQVPGSAGPAFQLPQLPDVDPDESLNILIVDDDALTRMLMTKMLSRLKQNVKTAENGLIAIRMIKQAYESKDERSFDACFLDNQMPEMNGVEVVREVRSEKIPLFVCGVTGNALKEDQDEYWEAGVDQLLTKPVLERNVRDVLETVQSSRRRPGASFPHSHAVNESLTSTS